ncbi:PREDICTED: uncharacterized protein LOC109160487 [Ipomoea nil]|uniref:uncharacterized protein LOC109160487 n=1 Tax=Ipomoea nil TaxID=35883 RepID=UPI00090198C7|nr:PREDICTED: uncharacterized protein LOC109160487 [Ipomoea nil]
MSWNCRGLGNPTAIRVLADLVRMKRPKVVFFMETFVDRSRMESVRVQLGFDSVFVVDAVGHSGGLAMLWLNSVCLQVTAYDSNFIDARVELEAGSPGWRFTGYYGFSERARRREAWQLLRNLAGQSTEPWVIMGELNDLLHQNEKKSRAPHPPWCITGFGDAVVDCGLQDLPFSEYQYTWVRSWGRSYMVEEKLDRILVTEDWRTLFAEATTCSLPCVYSDHMPLLLTPVAAVNAVRRKRFLFDNMWLREDGCREIVAHSWDRTRQDVLRRIESCGRDIWKWGKTYNRDF